VTIGGSFGNLLAHWGIWWLIAAFGGSFQDAVCALGDLVARWNMWLLIERCGGSLGDVVANLKYGGPLGHVMAHLGMW